MFLSSIFKGAISFFFNLVYEAADSESHFLFYLSNELLLSKKVPNG